MLIYWDFHAQPSLGFTEIGPKKRKYPVSGSCVDENALLMSGQRRMGRLVRDDRKVIVTQISTRYNQGMQNTISEHTTHRTLKQMGYSSRRPHRVPLLSAKNRKWRLFLMKLSVSVYSALLCIVVSPMRFTIMQWWWWVSSQPPPMCSIHLDNAIIRRP